MSKYNDTELLSRYISVLAESAYEALVLSQASLQLLIKHEIISHKEATEMKRIVEANTTKVKALRIAIGLYDSKKAEADDFENLFKKMLDNKDSMTNEERERLLKYLDNAKK